MFALHGYWRTIFCFSNMLSQYRCINLYYILNRKAILSITNYILSRKHLQKVNDLTLSLARWSSQLCTLNLILSRWKVQKRSNVFRSITLRKLMNCKAMHNAKFWKVHFYARINSYLILLQNLDVLLSWTGYAALKKVFDINLN